MEIMVILLHLKSTMVTRYKVYGGSGNDNINVGTDYLRTDYYYVYGEDGADYINVVSNAAIYGGPKDDTIYCTGYQCEVNGDDGNDKLHVEAHDIESGISGGSGNDKIYFKGSGGNSGAAGDDGNDHIFVDGSGSSLNGGNGNDILEATGAYNEYTGGPGADNFKCSPGTGDVVQDYNPAEGDTVSANCETVL
jgi:Ca2+-binding RTX toxin-like protein